MYCIHFDGKRGETYHLPPKWMEAYILSRGVGTDRYWGLAGEYIEGVGFCTPVDPDDTEPQLMTDEELIDWIQHNHEEWGLNHVVFDPTDFRKHLEPLFGPKP